MFKTTFAVHELPGPPLPVTHARMGAHERFKAGYVKSLCRLNERGGTPQLFKHRKGYNLPSTHARMGAHERLSRRGWTPQPLKQRNIKLWVHEGLSKRRYQGSSRTHMGTHERGLVIQMRMGAHECLSRRGLKPQLSTHGRPRVFEPPGSEAKHAWAPTSV